ncbi:homeobox-domain-containing protein [Auriscalpium vulgare]|uniref:Homeobox-domain-containing protein n=1 Tax=Auriscalpium vulgare TaxID=40419 RepID=A0ACB8RLZ4_9AGAM|nr:homeobox-domain-containing protein [Auriscalpium vulgare]
MRPPTRTTRSTRGHAAAPQPVKPKSLAARPTSTPQPAQSNIPEALPESLALDSTAANVSEGVSEGAIDPEHAQGSKKQKGNRHRMTEEKLARLDAVFETTTHPSRLEKEALSAELEMSMKSITIWFQNRRQTAKKLRDSSSTHTAAVDPTSTHTTDILSFASAPPVLTSCHTKLQHSHISLNRSASSHALTGSGMLPLAPAPPPPRLLVPLPRRPLAMLAYNTIYPRYGLERARSYHNVVSNHPQRSFTAEPVRGLATHRTTSVLPHDLWKHIPSSPIEQHIPSSPDVSLASDDATPTRKRPGTLEWACALHAKRRRENPGAHWEEDEQAVEVHLGPRTPQRMRRGSVSYPTSVARVPNEYHALFSPDIVKGAVLLLGMKRAASFA